MNAEKNKKDVLNDLMQGKTTKCCETCKYYIPSTDPLDNIGTGKCELDKSFCFHFNLCDSYLIFQE